VRVFYFRGVRTVSSGEGLLLGVLWFVISVAIDLPADAESAHQLHVEDMWRIALTYVMIPGDHRRQCRDGAAGRFAMMFKFHGRSRLIISVASNYDASLA